MALGKKMEDEQRIRDENRRDAESSEELESALGKNNEKIEGKDDICLPDLEKSLNDFQHLIKYKKDIDKILEKNDIKNNKELANVLDKYKELRTKNEKLEKDKEQLENDKLNLNNEVKNAAIELKKRSDTIKRLEETERLLKEENKHLKEEKSVFKIKVKKNFKTPEIDDLNIQDVPEILQDPAFDHLIGGNLSGWYWIAPYGGNLEDYTQNKMEDMNIKITRAGHLKKKNIGVSVDKKARIIYIEKNVYKKYENELNVADGVPIIVI